MKKLAVIVLLLSAAQVAVAGVNVRRDDGLIVIYNETPSQHARRAATSLVPVPEARLTDLISRYAGENGLDPKLVRAVVQVESGYNAAARSNKGAMGLMQLMPQTAASLEVSDPYDPDENVRAGTAYLRTMLNRFDGDLENALAGYNAGPEAVVHYGGVPPYPETRAYVERVMRLVSGDQSFRLPPSAPRGRRTYVTRDASGQLRITTAPPPPSH
jgi:soluble lytic murein transglycosylase-like protein